MAPVPADLRRLIEPQVGPPVIELAVAVPTRAAAIYGSRSRRSLLRVTDALLRLLPWTTGLFLYFPRQAQDQPKLRAFIDMVRAVLRPGH